MILNLADVKKSDIKYKLIKFSDSHTHVDFENINQVHTVTRVTIKTRLSSLDDVFILLQATQAIRSVRNSIDIDLVITYLICGRYDRPMHQGDSFDLKIITDLIDQQRYSTISVYEPHSAISTALLSAQTVHVMDEHVRKELEKYQNFAENRYDNVCIVAPDLGAVKRVEDFAKTLHGEIPIVYCHKDRNILTGEIKGIKILNKDNLRKNVLIYDDLCDGGRTFVELAKEIKNSYDPHAWITLAVTHGIFSKGFDAVRPWISKIITTNSYKEYDQNNVATLISLFGVQLIDVI